jgi:hypothetical protein
VRTLSSFGLRTRALSLSAAVLGGETTPEKSKPSMGAGRVALPASSPAVQINEHDGVVVSGLLGSALAARSTFSSILSVKRARRRHSGVVLRERSGEEIASTR